MQTIYHITLPERWAEALSHGEYRADSLESEGFIHCSDAPQVERSLNRFYRNVPEVRLLHIDPDRLLSRLEYEPAHGELFPHIYGPLNIDAVVSIETLRAGDDGGYRWGRRSESGVGSSESGVRSEEFRKSAPTEEE